MNAARGMAPAAAPSSALKYIFYIVAALAIVYVVSRLTFNGASQDIAVTGTTQSGAPAAKEGKFPSFTITDDSRLRIKPGGEYTFSFWVYINTWGDRGSKPSNVLRIADETLDGHSLLAVMLYPTEPTMAIRFHTGTGTGNFTNDTERNALINSGTGSLSAPVTGTCATDAAGSTPQCDLKDIDMQRWINITVTTNGRMVDVYYDGKLARSCILPNIIKAGNKGVQSVKIGENGGFQGSFGVMNYYAYTLTPDRIYSIYLAGPGGPPTFLSYLEKQLGVNLVYSAAAATGAAAAGGGSS